MKQPVVIRVYKGDRLEAVRQFEEKQIVIGRENVQLALQSNAVSLLHAMIEERDDQYFLSDLGSQSGTFKNGQRILEEKLQSGDTISLGPYLLQFFVGPPKMTSPSPVPETTLTSIIPPLPEEEVDSEITEISEEPEEQQTKTDIIPDLPSSTIVRTSVTEPTVFDASLLVPDDDDGKEVTLSLDAVTLRRDPDQLPKTAPPKPKAPSPKAPSLKAPPSSVPPKVTTRPPPTPEVRVTPPGGFKPPKEENNRSAAFITPGKKKKRGKTFAPPSPYRDARDIVKPGKGSVVEVLVLWHERVLNTYHFYEAGAVHIGGGPDADVVVPILSASSKFQLLQIVGGSSTVFISPEMTGELVRDRETSSLTELLRQSKLRAVGQTYQLDLRQGEMVRLGLQNDMISLMIRYKAETPRPVIAPLLDLSASETTGVILAGVISAIFALYMSLYAPSALMDDEAQVEEPLRKAVVTFTPPPESTPETKPEPVKKKVVEVTEKKKSVLSEAQNTSQQKKQEAAKSVAKAGEPGKAGEVAPKKTLDKKKTVTSARAGGAIKTAPKEGANMKSQKPDPTKVGLLSVFGSKGAQSKLDQAYSGSGELQGMADQANGNAGSNENRAGDTLGTKLKDTGAGGQGSSTIGIAGLGTNGRGTGNTGYGTGGLGSKGSTRVDVGGQDASWGGSIDKEAIRRVIRDHIREIRYCYDKELQSHPGLSGKIRIGWKINESGSATAVQATDNELGSSAVANCIVGKLKTWGFPPAPPDTEAHVVYPFVFSAE